MHPPEQRPTILNLVPRQTLRKADGAKILPQKTVTVKLSALRHNGAPQTKKKARQQ
jgi:hypothetical protein